MVVMPLLHEQEPAEGRGAQLRGAELCRALLLAQRERGAGLPRPS